MSEKVWERQLEEYITKFCDDSDANAQKYVIRQVNGGKDKRRSSIHDISTKNLSDSKPRLKDGPEDPGAGQVRCKRTQETAATRFHDVWPLTRGC